MRRKSAKRASASKKRPNVQVAKILLRNGTTALRKLKTLVQNMYYTIKRSAFHRVPEKSVRDLRNFTGEKVFAFPFFIGKVGVWGVVNSFWDSEPRGPAGGTKRKGRCGGRRRNVRRNPARISLVVASFDLNLKSAGALKARPVKKNWCYRQVYVKRAYPNRHALR